MYSVFRLIAVLLWTWRSEAQGHVSLFGLHLKKFSFHYSFLAYIAPYTARMLTITLSDALHYIAYIAELLCSVLELGTLNTVIWSFPDRKLSLFGWWTLWRLICLLRVHQLSHNFWGLTCYGNIPASVLLVYMICCMNKWLYRLWSCFDALWNVCLVCSLSLSGLGRKGGGHGLVCLVVLSRAILDRLVLFVAWDFLLIQSFGECFMDIDAFFLKVFSSCFLMGYIL